jgi:hypothetical protein
MDVCDRDGLHPVPLRDLGNDECTSAKCEAIFQETQSEVWHTKTEVLSRVVAAESSHHCS